MLSPAQPCARERLLRQLWIDLVQLRPEFLQGDLGYAQPVGAVRQDGARGGHDVLGLRAFAGLRVSAVVDRELHDVLVIRLDERGPRRQRGIHQLPRNPGGFRVSARSPGTYRSPCGS